MSILTNPNVGFAVMREDDGTWSGQVSYLGNHQTIQAQPSCSEVYRAAVDFVASVIDRIKKVKG